jgi:hypothetical protein
LLNYDRSSEHFPARDEIADLDFHQIAPSKLAIDCEVEERAVPKPVLAIEVEANCPYLPGLQRAFCSDPSTGVPSGTRR